MRSRKLYTIDEYNQLVEDCEQLLIKLEEHGGLEDAYDALESEIFAAINKDIPFEFCSKLKQEVRLLYLQDAYDEALGALSELGETMSCQS